jgi:hypothetical protein
LNIFVIMDVASIDPFTGNTHCYGQNYSAQACQSMLEGIELKHRSDFLVIVGNALVRFIEPIQSLERFGANFIHGSGLLSLDGRTVGHNYTSAISDQLRPMLYELKGSEHIDFGTFTLLTSLLTKSMTMISQWTTLIVLDFEPTVGPTLYLAEQSLNSKFNDTNLQIDYINQNSGKRLFQLLSADYGFVARDSVLKQYLSEETVWDPNIAFNPYSGSHMIGLVYQVPSEDRQAVYRISATQDISSVSALLRSFLVAESKQRLFANIRSKEGALIGASHGKCFNQSENNDLNSNNPFTNPVPGSASQIFTPATSTDKTIRAAGQWVIHQYKHWDAIPEIHTKHTIGGKEFYIDITVFKPELGTTPFLNIFLLTDVSSQMALPCIITQPICELPNPMPTGYRYVGTGCSGYRIVPDCSGVTCNTHFRGTPILSCSIGGTGPHHFQFSGCV